MNNGNVAHLLSRLLFLDKTQQHTTADTTELSPVSPTRIHSWLPITSADMIAILHTETVFQPPVCSGDTYLTAANDFTANPNIEE